MLSHKRVREVFQMRSSGALNERILHSLLRSLRRNAKFGSCSDFKGGEKLNRRSGEERIEQEGEQR